MCGYAGLILEVGLSGSTLNTRSIDQADARLYLGGSGLAARLLSGMNWSGDPFDPDLDLVFATGPITGTPAPCSGRYVVAAKSPLTGGWGEAHASGYWGPELKFAGFDAVVVSDRAERPVYLWIVDGKAELRDASFLWGRDTYETEEILQRELGDPKARVLAIGPAGENRCRIASIMSDHGRAAARGGLGSVMGSKNLKAIAVRGTGRLKLADEKGFADLKSSLIKMIKASPGRQALHTHGTNAAMEAIYAKGDVPIKNWTRGVWDGIGKLTGPAVTQAILKGTSTCRGCPIGCGRMIEVKTGDYAGLKGKGPEYETIAAFGPLSLNDDLGAIAKANDLCNRYGLDTISTGAVIAMAMECRERGLLSEADLGGIDLTWGNGAGIVAMVEKIARRQGLGDLLAEGTLRAARRIGGGAEETAVQTKGFELPMHDPRGFGSWAVAYATAARGGCHVTAPAYWLERGITFPDLGYPEPMDRFNPEGKGRWTAIFQDMCEVMEAMVICKFSVYGGIRSHHLVELIARATGWDVDHREVMQMGERIVNLKKLINLKLGFSNKDDTLPKRLLTISLKEGGSEGHVPDQASMLAEYYRHRGWSEQGVPTAAKLKELGLDGEIGQKLQGAKA
jgi:aldehyde:ferredoxin oxidoreductase